MAMRVHHKLVAVFRNLTSNMNATQSSGIKKDICPSWTPEICKERSVPQQGDISLGRGALVSW